MNRRDFAKLLCSLPIVPAIATGAPTALVGDIVQFLGQPEVFPRDFGSLIEADA